MRIFVGYGYNPRDSWIEKDVFPILQAMNLEVVHGKDMYGETLQDGVKQRIAQSDALIAFCTLRVGQEAAEFNTHIWVRDEMVHALALGMPVIEIREKDVKNPPGVVGDRQRIDLNPDDRLTCISELATFVNRWSMRRLLLVPTDQKVRKQIAMAMARRELITSYRTRFNGTDSQPREGRLEKINSGLYLNAIGLPNGALVEIEGTTKTNGLLFSTGWNAADLVRIEF